ncbi:hypothetical protein GCM10010172_16800 [Paractinoplanes ferrugineus]|uniref:Glycosyltransferase 2-like domain-containing protein n=1 Tax=Paractinoplanes ferrugineus TaxID=113564 RepID=A0A919IY07_9ACTN|nr:hypothetical protein Afe05nite_20840 [Actinoplanes ferrugineus]
MEPMRPVLDVVLPVYNEAADLERSVHRLHGYLLSVLPFPFRITIADNASSDATPLLAGRLAVDLPEVTAVHLAARGRGRALKYAWLNSDADVLAYLDIDLAIGSRLKRGSQVVRGPKREFLSRAYNMILKATLGARFSDAQCGFKATRADVARQLLPLVQDTNWFFDTEMLVLAERAGLRTHEVPVDWVDDPNSKVDILATAQEDLRGIARLRRTMPRASELATR